MYCGSETLAKLFFNRAQQISQTHIRPVLSSAYPLWAVIWCQLLLCGKRLPAKQLFLLVCRQQPVDAGNQSASQTRKKTAVLNLVTITVPLSCSKIISCASRGMLGYLLKWPLHAWVCLCGRWSNARLFSFGLVAWNELSENTFVFSTLSACKMFIHFKAWCGRNYVT